jgi:hypothetical protein
MYKNPYAKLKPSTRRPYTEIYLIRHCHPDYRQEKKLGEYNMPLSTTGLRQRDHLTKKLLTLKINKVYSSSLARSRKQPLFIWAKPIIGCILMSAWMKSIGRTGIVSNISI